MQYNSNTDSNTRTNVWNYRSYIATLQYTCCTQTDNQFTTTAYLCQGQRQSGGQTGTLATCITYSTDCYQRLTLESWFTNLEQTPLNRSQQLPAPYKRLIDEIKQTYYERTTEELTIWPTKRRLFNCDNRRIETHQLLITRLHSQ